MAHENGAAVKIVLAEPPHYQSRGAKGPENRVSSIGARSMGIRPKIDLGIRKADFLNLALVTFFEQGPEDVPILLEHVADVRKLAVPLLHMPV